MPAKRIGDRRIAERRKQTTNTYGMIWDSVAKKFVPIYHRLTGQITTNTRTTDRRVGPPYRRIEGSDKRAGIERRQQQIGAIEHGIVRMGKKDYQKLKNPTPTEILDFNKRFMFKDRRTTERRKLSGRRHTDKK